jgi:hypothetical protein
VIEFPQKQKSRPSPAAAVGQRKPDPNFSIGALHLPAQLGAALVAACPALRLCIANAVDSGFWPAHEFRVIPADTVPDNETSKILPTADEIGPVVINRLTTHRARQA